MYRFAVGIGAVSALAVVLAGCASTNTSPGLQEQRLESIQSHIASVYQRYTPEDLAGVQHVSYFVAHGVSGRIIPLFDPALCVTKLAAADGKPPATLRVLIGLDGLRQTNIATDFEVMTDSRGGTPCNAYVLAWDSRRRTWGTLASWSHAPMKRATSQQRPCPAGHAAAGLGVLPPQHVGAGPGRHAGSVTAGG
jgi:hypothetical protein